MTGIGGFYRQTMHSYFLGTMWCFVRIRFLELELSELWGWGFTPPILRIKPESIIIFTSSNRETYQLIREKVICVKFCQRFLAVWSTNTQSRRNLVFFFEIRPINIVTNVFGPLFFWRTNDKKWLSTYGRIAWLAWLKRPVTAFATESTSYTACDWVIGKKANFWVYIIRSGRAKWNRIFGGTPEQSPQKTCCDS